MRFGQQRKLGMLDLGECFALCDSGLEMHGGCLISQQDLRRIVFGAQTSIRRSAGA
jgi:hypothetical protein